MLSPNPKRILGNDPKLMTGQEWYDRFEKELRGLKIPYGGGIKYVVLSVEAETKILKAAKKAAGIDD